MDYSSHLVDVKPSKFCKAPRGNSIEKYSLLLNEVKR